MIQDLSCISTIHSQSLNGEDVLVFYIILILRQRLTS